ncbi:cytidylate kinase-like family protein [Desulforhabdus amnigena]|jgi:cytidylate kinase|uniref:Phospholipid-binding protein n=1 Tax=Desulforhabdus amnigena TaxID=40218 RepID=A0A9W6CZE5_9BACT|nr:cytidylate kinase-like family protein [Desulforhabdus amnigena]NLJ27308.1 cytidylate kinase-like family protein [Deltaproteobacteria bacterium]GLI32955.1 phospholipid-binding protein [Desulforhabdus amnigena]
MAIITLSRDSYSRGKEVAEKVAKELGYDCISREILLEASEIFNIPQIKLYRAIHDAPSILDRLTNGKQRYIAYIRATLLDYLRKDNVVYHGLAGHFFVREIPHALRVRIIANMDERVRVEMERENISKKEAMELLKSDDEQRRKWSKSLYGLDTSDPSLYDLIIHLKKISVDEAVETICYAARQKCFETTPQSQKAMDDLALAAEVNAAIIEMAPHARLFAEDGNVTVTVKSQLEDTVLTSQIMTAAKNIKGVKTVKVEMEPFSLYAS